jgi:hypothetical protein
MALPIPPVPVPEPDYPAQVRPKLAEALAMAKAAVDAPPWDYKKRYWGVVFPQMSRWLPDEERQPLVDEFKVEWERIEQLFGEEGKGS